MNTLTRNLQRYVDGQMNASERQDFEVQLDRDPGLREELEGFRALGQELANLPVPESIPAEPVWSNVQRQIRLEDTTAPRSNRMVWRWALAPLAAAALWAVTLLNPMMGGAGSGPAIVEMVEVGDAQRIPMVYTSQETGATVVWLSSVSNGSRDATL